MGSRRLPQPTPWRRRASPLDVGRSVLGRHGSRALAHVRCHAHRAARGLARHAGGAHRILAGTDRLLRRQPGPRHRTLARALRLKTRPRAYPFAVPAALTAPSCPRTGRSRRNPEGASMFSALAKSGAQVALAAMLGATGF